MSVDPRAALTQLVSALERHLEASTTRRGEDDPVVIAAYEDLVDAFESYDAALYDATGEMTPFDIYGDDDSPEDIDHDDDDFEDDDDDDDDTSEVDDHDDEDGDDDHVYAGLADSDTDNVTR